MMMMMVRIRSQKDLSKAERKVVCKCGIGARQRTVSKDNANQNRRFWGCAKYPNGCNFFQWARKEDWDHGRSFTSKCGFVSNR